MAFLERINYRPTTDNLTDAEKRMLEGRFDAYGAELVINGVPITWESIQEVEVVVAARASGPAGWIVKHLVMGGERYHVGVYFGQSEAVMPNVTRNVAQFIVQTIAYYAPYPVTYKGVEGLAPLREG